MPPAAPSSQGQPDNSTGIIWTVAFIFVVLAVIWFVFKKHLVTFYLTIKLYEVYLLNLFDPTYFLTLQDRVTSAIANPLVLGFNQIVDIGAAVGNWLRIPYMVILILLAFFVYLSSSTRVFKRAYNMQQLASLEKVNWPQITPTLHLNLLKVDINKGPWAMAMTPMQFCKHNNLLEEVRVERREGMARKDWDRISVILKKGEANKLFALQVGAQWKGVDKLPPHVRALFAVFAARVNADSKAAHEVLMRLSASPPNKLNMTGVDDLLKKHHNTKLVQKIEQAHGYVLTVMAAMLEGAREDGVQASADFLWLKPIDRRLWYMLNTVGRQTPFVEVAGPFAHWIAEKEASGKVMVPVIEEATKALELALSEVLYKRDEEPIESKENKSR
ncbi:MAG TPA: type IVB secretion system coupling complex protein DotM/IcmP [Gammaproteobacteria bacterium]|jgi:intracellular multiplication protein IcmP|nr:type IVB secretion system coupling complex protein DotM/IcmP [Gammaproteobacteria bacterium]